MIFGRTKTELPSADQALSGRETRPFNVPATHAVLGTPIEGPTPDGFEVAVFGLGCFWGEEKMFWEHPGRLLHVSRLRRRRHAEPDVRGGLQRAHRAGRGRAGGLRPVEGVV